MINKTKNKYIIAKSNLLNNKIKSVLKHSTNKYLNYLINAEIAELEDKNFRNVTL